MDKKEFTVYEFVSQFEKYPTDNLKDKFVNDNLDVTKYVSFGVKESIANNIVETTTKGIPDENGVRKIEVNSRAKFLLSICSVINTWTNINIDFSNILEEYDALAGSGALDFIITKIPEKEITEFQNVLNMCVSDAEANVVNPLTRAVSEFKAELGAVIAGVMAQQEEQE